MEIELHHLVLFVVYLQIIHNEWDLYRDEAISLNWTYITNSGHVWFAFFKNMIYIMNPNPRDLSFRKVGSLTEFSREMSCVWAFPNFQLFVY